MPVEKEGLEQGQDYKFSDSGTVSYQGKDSSGFLHEFKPVSGRFSGETIKLTKHQVRLLIRPRITFQNKP